jgi:SAM-dependent methyltransferase
MIPAPGRMTATAPSIFDRMSVLADTTRSRLLLLLERHELTVGELCAVLQLPQSTVSRHLKVLGDEGWVVSRPEGTSRCYRMRPETLDRAAGRLWGLVREQVGGDVMARQDSERVAGVLAQRRTRSQAFFSSAVGEWDRLRVELFGPRAELLGLLGLLDETWVVGDLGCGTGHVSESLAPFVARTVAVDDSPAMLDAARERLAHLQNAEVRAGDLGALPLRDAELDAAVLFLVLHHQPEPEEVLREVARSVRTGGRLHRWPTPLAAGGVRPQGDPALAGAGDAGRRQAGRRDGAAARRSAEEYGGAVRSRWPAPRSWDRCT